MGQVNSSTALNAAEAILDAAPKTADAVLVETTHEVGTLEAKATSEVAEAAATSSVDTIEQASQSEVQDTGAFERVRNSERLLDRTLDPIPFDQGVLDHVVSTDPALANVRLSANPRISADLPNGTIGRSYLSRDRETNILVQNSEIGPGAFRNRGDLIGTIIHEETHLRFGARLEQGIARYQSLDSSGLEENYVLRVEQRFLRMQEGAGR